MNEGDELIGIEPRGTTKARGIFFNFMPSESGAVAGQDNASVSA